jgi:anti-sigma factor RsiW
MNRRDLEQLSAYLDGELRPSDLAKMEKRLQSDLELESALQDLRATRTLLRSLPRRKSPRNFTLTRKMAGQNPPLPRTYPLFRLATMVATLLLFFTFGVNTFGSQMASPDAGFGIGGSGGGSDASDSELYAAEAPAAETEEPVMTEEPAAPPPLATFDASVDTPSVEDSLRAIETQSLKTSEAENAVEAEQVQESQEVAPIVPTTWQITLAVVAVLSALFMVAMRQVSARRWK